LHAISTPRLRLEPQAVAHAEEMFAVLSDPAIYEYENAPPRSLEWLRERYARLESRRSPDGEQQWLNWVIRLSSGELIGYVQATVFATGRAAIAYEMCSHYWGRGLAREACEAVLSELAVRYGARTAHAIFKQRNHRSLRLLQRLGFAPAAPAPGVDIEPDEVLMTRELARHAPIRDAGPIDFPAIVALNAGSEQYLSPMSAARLAQLHAWAAYHRAMEVGAEVAAFLIAFREGADYDSPNYRWFGARYASFVYVDRVVVAAAHRGRGFASALYDDVFAFARENGVATVTCEFDTDPPNEVSRRFHARFGFSEVGTHSYNNKRVSMQATSADAARAARSSTAPRR
jgi:predicted GNAT superfamily acetyltransferase